MWPVDRRCFVFRSSISRPIERISKRRQRVFLERLEDRLALTVEPISMADASFFGEAGEGSSLLRGQAASISADGQLVVFQSDANDLAPNDTNKASNSSANLTDIFLFNRSTGAVTLVSVNVDGTASGADSSFNPKISPDGRFILFESEAPNLTSETIINGGGHPDIFLCDLQTRTTTLVSKSASGTTGGNGGSSNASMSADGRYVVFESNASNLVADDTNGDRADIFLRDLQTGTTTLVSRTPGGNSGNDNSFDARISDNGRFVAYTSYASDLVANDTTNVEDIFVYDRETGVNELISVDSDEVNQSNAHNALSPGRAISADGRYVIFETNATNLVPQNGGFEGRNIYLRDRQLGTTTAVTLSANGQLATGGAAGSMTPDGRLVAFVSGETDLVTGVPDTNGAADVFLRDLVTGTTRIVSLNATATATGDRTSGTGQYPFDFSPGAPVVSADGRYVAFASEASNLVAGLTDNNDSRMEAFGTHRRDVFLRDMQTNATTLMSVNRADMGTGENGSFTPAMSADGSVIAFESLAGDLVAGQDKGGFQDVFVRDVNAGETELVSQRTPLFPAERLRGGTLADVSGDARFAAFISGANIVPNVPLEFGAHLYVRDRLTGAVSVEDVAGGVAREGFPRAAQLSDDGRFIVFGSIASLDPNVADPNRRGQLYVRDRQANVTRMVTLTASGQASDGIDLGPRDFAFSPDSRYVAFTTQAGGMVSGFTDNNGSVFGLGRDVFLRDLVTGTTRLVSHTPGTTTSGGNGSSFWPVFSADGSKLAFASLATDLDGSVSDQNNAFDLFVFDLASGVVEAASVADGGGSTGNAASGGDADTLLWLAGDGRYLFFGSSASNLVAGDTNGVRDIFRRDLVSDTTSVISIGNSGLGNAQSYNFSVSGDGNVVAFTSAANNLIAGDTNNRSDVFLRNISNATTVLVSAATSGMQANDASIGPLISPDGSHVAFQSQATNLVPAFTDANGEFRNDVFIRRIADGVTSLVTSSNTGITGADTGNFSNFQFVGNDTLFFESDAGNVFNGDRDNTTDVFAYTAAGAGRISGRVFTDANSNGSQDAAEAGIPFLTVYVDANGNGEFDPGELNRQTDLAGNYAFTDVVAGTYTIAVRLPEGFAVAAPVAGTHTVTLASDTAASTGHNFGVVQAVSDLLVTQVSAPATIAAGRDFTVEWSVRDNAAQAITGDWQDAVYLSQDDTLDAGDRLLGVLPHTGGLADGATYSQSLDVHAPPVAIGDYRIIVQTDRRTQVGNDSNRSNNFGASGTVALLIPELSIDAPLADQFTAPGQEHYYQVTVAAGQPLVLTLDSAAAGGATELYVRFASLPTPYEFGVAVRDTRPDQMLTVPVAQPGTYFVLARSAFGAAAVSPFTLTATQPALGIDAIGPNSGGNVGRVTVEIRGTNMTPSSDVRLVSGSTEIPAAEIDFRDASVLYATFEMAGQAVGAYDVRLTDAGQTVTLFGAFELASTSVNDGVRLFLTVPDVVRTGRTGEVLVDYVNTSNTDVTAPLLQLTSDQSLLRLEDDEQFRGSTIQFLGISRSGPAGILRPGESGRVRVTFQHTGPSDVDINFRVDKLASESVPMDWVSAKEPLRPGHIGQEAWEAVFANLLAEAGTTTGDYQSMLAGAATYLSGVGVYTPSVTRLLTFEIGKADAVYTSASLASVVDATFPTPGDDLVFVRSHQDSIHGRYELGPFGRGWTHNWDIQAITLPTGDVVLRFGGGRRFFARQPDGSFHGVEGDNARLVFSGDVYVLTEVNSTQFVFRPDGLLDFTEGDNGNRVTASYTASGRLETLTHSSGATIALEYDHQDLIVGLTDPAGRVVTYTYDASGEHLVSYSDKYGTHGYTYVAGQQAATEHALATIDFSDDTHRQFTYDARGRLVRENRDAGAVPISYEYLPGGGYVVSGGPTGQQTILQNDLGQVAKTIDALGRVASNVYDVKHNLVQADYPEGVRFTYGYDSRGNLTGLINALGQQTQFRYDDHNNLLSYTDARGNSTRYAYDAEDNLLDITYANGSVESYEYDALGNLAERTNRRGQPVGYTYNTRGQITSKEFADGTHADFTYDARGNLATATDAEGTISLSYNTLDALAKIDYPDGKFLQFEYNVVGQRTKSTDQDGYSVNYSYDDLGRLERLTDSGGLIVRYTFDAAGRLARRDNGNGTASIYEYDTGGQLLRIRHLAADGVTANSYFEYTYDKLGRRNTMRDAEGTTQYGYDALGQLTSVMLPDGRTIAYQYDGAGNRLSVIDSQLGTTNYVANELNEYAQVGDTSYTYDADGNLRSKQDGGGETVFTFDDENRLTGVRGPSLTASYSYDALGHRDTATVDGQTTQFLIDPLGLWSAAAEYSNAGSLIAHNTYGLGLTSRVGPSGAAAYYDFDAMGNTVGLTDATGAYANRYQYLPFGETTIVSAALPNPFTFVGQFGVMSDASNLPYMRFRNYDPTTGQFISTDPNGIKSGDTNLRRYVLNSPTTTVDPFGLEGNGGATSGKFEITICPVILPERRAWLYKDPGWQGAPYKMSDGLIKEETKVGNDWFKTPLAPTLDVNGQPYVPQPPEMVPNPFPYGDPGNCISGGRPGCNCGCPPGTPPGFPPAPGPGGSTRPRGSFDPNEITGPAGFGDEKFIQPEGTWPYTVRFENDPLQATAPAQEVFVTHQLDGDLDWNTFELGDFGFGSQTLDVPDGVQSYETRVEYQNQDGTPLLVDVDASLDRQTGIVSWTFRSVNPETGTLPEDVFAGFLPVNDASGRGEGFVTYLIQPKNNLATGVTVDQQASIVFDTNTPVITNTFTNTIDAGLPSSSVEVLSPITTSAAFTVSWSGDDDAGGSGIASFDVFVSENDGPYTLFQDGTTGTSAQFTGTAGRTYRFYSVATDNVGHVESAPQEPDAQTTIDIPISPQLAVSAIQGPVVAVPGQLRSYFVTFTDAAAVGDHTAAIDWGDGTVEDAFVAETTNGGATTGAVSFWHTYTGFGDFEPKLTVRDSQNHQTVIDGFITVQTITLQPDPLDTAKTALLVGGLATVNDLILFEPEPNTTRVRLYYNGSDMGAFSFNGSIGAYGQTGNDLIQVSPVLAVPALLYGQEGNDILVGGAANDILVGSTGNDILYGSGGRDLLFGGLGSDYLQGSGFSGLSVGDDSDVLVADYSVIDYDVALLDQVYDRWSDNSPYANRVAGLRTAPLPVGLNDMSVLNDFAIDRLFGGSDSDWLHYRLGMDFASDLQAGEDVN